MSDKTVLELYESTNYWGWVEDLYLAGNDDGVALRIYNGQPYEPESRKLWRSLCKGAELVVDVGAHTGIYSIDAYKAGAKECLSIEPYHINYARLVMNLRHAGFNAACAVFCAVSDKNGSAAFTPGTHNYFCSSGGRVGRTEIPTPHYPIILQRLDSLVSKDLHSKVSVVKIDTEYHGVRVLSGMPHILSYKPDLILECIEEGLGDVLKPFGYKFFKINEKTGLEPVDDLIPDDPITHDSPNRYATVK